MTPLDTAGGPGDTGPMALTPETLKARRLALGLTQAQLADALDMGAANARTIRRWELGERAIPGPIALALTALEAGLRA